MPTSQPSSSDIPKKLRTASRLMHGCEMSVYERSTPLRFHWIWLGQNPVPAPLERWIKSWRERHPSWEVYLWRDHDLPPLRMQACFDETTSHAQKADIHKRQTSPDTTLFLIMAVRTWTPISSARGTLSL